MQRCSPSCMRRSNRSSRDPLSATARQGLHCSSVKVLLLVLMALRKAGGGRAADAHGRYSRDVQQVRGGVLLHGLVHKLVRAALLVEPALRSARCMPT